MRSKDPSKAVLYDGDAADNICLFSGRGRSRKPIKGIKLLYKWMMNLQFRCMGSLLLAGANLLYFFERSNN